MNKNRLFAIVIVILFIGAVILLAQRNAAIQKTNKLQVAASFYPMYFFAQQIGGDKTNVYDITPASSEPHDYEPTTQDIVRIETSDLFILNGGGLEPWATKITSDIQGTKPYVVTAGTGITSKMMEENGQNITDPHVWLDPLLAKVEIVRIEKGFEKVDPKDSSYFHLHAEKLLSQLDALDQTYKNGLTHCHLKDFVTSHAAFAYMAQQYHLNQIAISGISPDEEPSSQKLAQIVTFINTKHIPVIFFESLVSPKLSDTIAQETGAKTLVLNPLEGIPQNELDKGANYFSVMQQNLANLQIALQCRQ